MKLGPDGPPLPWLPLYPTNMTVYALGTLNGVSAFAYDDRPQLNRGEDDPPTPGDPGEGEDPGVPLGRPVDIGTDLYLDIGPLTNHFAWLALTNTVSGKYYQLLSAAAVTNSPWQLGQIVPASSSHTFFDNARTDYPTRRFFRGVGADVIASIRLHPDYNLAVEPATNGGAAQNGKFQITLNTAASYSVTVAYTISGTASNGVDYTLSGSGTISAGQTNAIIEVQPLYDTLPEFDESVTLTLVLSNGYLVSPSSATATLKIYDPRPSGMAVAILDSGWTKFHGLSTTNWSYFTLPEAMKEALRSDGTPYVVVSDLDIANGVMTNANGTPKYPILICLANEVVRDDEIAPLTNYVAAGGFVFAGSSAFTRNTNGSFRSDFALASQMGLSGSPSAGNWITNNVLRKQVDHTLTRHIPSGDLSWRMPLHADELSWGSCADDHEYRAPHFLWSVSGAGAQMLATHAGGNPYLAVNPFGSGYFIYDAALNPIIAHGGNGVGMYAYLILRRATEWAFENAQRPVVKLSPWPYQKDAAFMVRHDLENYVEQIANVSASAQYEHARGAKGDYYFCTGAITNDGVDFSGIVNGLNEAVSYGATIGPHNGGLPNPRLSDDVTNGCYFDPLDYQYFHWGPDESYDLLFGYEYASNSVAISFAQIDAWVTNQPMGIRAWVIPYFNGTREDSYSIQEKLGIKVAGEQKLSPLPHWNLSTREDGKRYGFLCEPASDWFVQNEVAQGIGIWQNHLVSGPGFHTAQSIHEGVEFYYTNGFLINFYGHSLTSITAGTTNDIGKGAELMANYVADCTNHARIWAVNAKDVYNWWLARSSAQISASYSTTNSGHSLVNIVVAGAQDTNTAIEILSPGSGSAVVAQLLANGSASTNYRTVGELIKVLVGTTVTNIQLEYFQGPVARNDFYVVNQTNLLTVSLASGAISNDWQGTWSDLTATTVSLPAHGTLSWSTDGSFTYNPSTNGTECFQYSLADPSHSFGSANVSILVTKAGRLFSDDFNTCSPGTLAPWQTYPGSICTKGSGVFSARNSSTYAYAYVTNLWTNSNFSVEAQVQFASGTFGGGLGTRVHTSTNAHYAAWLYPSSGTVSLVKFYDWTHWGNDSTDNSLPIASTTVGTIGTSWHSLKLSCSNSVFQIFYDGTNVITAADNFSAYSSTGGASLDVYGGTISATNLLVTPYP